MENLNAEQVVIEIQSLIKALKANKGWWENRGRGGWFNHDILVDAVAVITSQEQRIKELTEENEKLNAMVGMWKSTAYCEKDRLNSIKADTIHKLKRDLYVEFLYVARCQKDNEPNLTSQEVFDALDRVAKRHLDVSGNDNRCVSCGEIIPEGRQVCPLCECKRNDEGS